MSAAVNALPTTLGAPAKPSAHWGQRLTKLGTYTILLVWTLLIYFPLYYIFITSFKKPVDVARGGLIPWVQFEPVLTAWQDVLVGPQSQAVIKHYSNSLFIAITAALLTTLFGAMAGYGLSRFRYKVLWMKNEDLAFWFISQRMLPPVAVVLAYLLLYRDLRLLDTHSGLIIAYIGFNLPLVVWIMRDFFQQIPREIEESAAIDGASRWLIFWRIAMPLALPGLIASFLLALIFSFNEYLFAVILSATNSTTFPILLAAQFTGDSIRYWILSALALMNIIPAAIVAVVLERFIVQGLFAGAVKQ